MRILVLSLALGFLAASPAHARIDKDLKQRITEVLKEGLNSRDALAQGRAMQALSEMGDKKVAKRAKEALEEENWSILQYALRIAASGRRPSKAFMPAMLKALENTRSRPHALTLLEELPNKLADSVYRASLSREASLRDQVLARMTDRGDSRSLAIIGHGLKAKKKDARKAALGTVGKLRGDAATRFLMKLAGSRKADERNAALDALLNSRAEEVTRFLKTQLKRTKDKKFKLRLARALADRRERDAAKPVLQSFMNAEDKALRVEALEGLAAVGDRVLAAKLRNTAINPKEDPDVAAAALHVLGGSGDVANLETLRAALATDHIHLRIGAVQGMGLLRREEAIGDLSGALRDGNMRVRLAAAAALGQVGGAAVVPPLEQAVIPETSSEVRSAIVQALGRSGATEGVQALQVLFAYKDKPDLVKSAVEAMLEIGDPAAVNVLLLAVDPSLPSLMEAAVKAVCLLDEKMGLTNLDAFLQRFSLEFVHDLNAEAGPRAVGYLSRFIEHGTADQRSLALDLLLRRGEKGLDQVRKAAKDNSDAAIRRMALNYLAGTKDEPSRGLFVAALADKDAGIKGIGLEAVTEFPKDAVTDEVRAAVDKLMQDRSPSVRVAAAHTLYRISK